MSEYMRDIHQMDGTFLVTIDISFTVITKWNDAKLRHFIISKQISFGVAYGTFDQQAHGIFFSPRGVFCSDIFAFIEFLMLHFLSEYAMKSCF